MATFSTQIQALVGSVTESEIDDWCTEGAKVIISNLPEALKEECSTLTNLYIGNTDTVMDLDLSGEILHVTRENADSGYHTPCRKINAMYGDLASDSGNIIHYATATDPVYWTGSDSGGDPKLFVKPTPTAVQPAKIYHIAYPTVDASAISAIVNFPDEAEYLVILYASCKVLQNKMNEKSASLPSDISDLTLPVVPTVPTISAQVVEAFSGAPTYTPPVSPTKESSATWASYWPGEIGDSDPGILSITSVPPTVPTVSAQVVEALGTAPLYTPPVAAFDIAQLEIYIETEEDTELASSQQGRIQLELSKYQADIQNALNIFNDANAEYQALMQEKFKEADLLDAHEARKLQKYQAEISTYQAEISKQTQQYQQRLSRYQLELNNTFQVWQTEEGNKQARHQADLGEYQTNIQNTLNTYNKENVIYQADIQENIKEADLLDGHEARKLQKYQAEVGTYSAQVNSNVQKFGQDLANYNAKIQKHSVDYQWLQGQYAMLKQDYTQGIAMLKGGGQPPPQQQGG